ncbi:MAG: DUF1456 family protein [Draconibacterium sp.]
MDNNDVLRRMRYAFELNDAAMSQVFELGGVQPAPETIRLWLKKDVDPEYVLVSDFNLAAFLNGFIISRRGKKEGPQPIPESRLSNNLILRKIKIALDLKDDDILQILELAGMKISRHELSALFRNPAQMQYRECKDQLLRNFVKGLQLKYREKKA